MVTFFQTGFAPCTENLAVHAYLKLHLVHAAVGKNHSQEVTTKFSLQTD